jgi:hypothetical protein
MSKMQIRQAEDDDGTRQNLRTRSRFLYIPITVMIRQITAGTGKRTMRLGRKTLVVKMNRTASCCRARVG